MEIKIDTALLESMCDEALILFNEPHDQNIVQGNLHRMSMEVRKRLRAVLSDAYKKGYRHAQSDKIINSTKEEE